MPDNTPANLKLNIDLKDKNKTFSVQKITKDTYIVSDKSSESKEKKKTPLKKKALYGILAIGAGTLFFTKGLSGKTAKWIGSYADKLENDLLMHADDSKIAQYVDKGLNGSSKAIKRLFSLSNIIANFNAVKDSFFKKMYSLNFLKIKKPESSKFPKLAKGWNYLVNIPTRFFDFMTNSILKITDNAIDSKYDNVWKYLNNYIATGVTNIEKSKLSPAEKKKMIEKLKNSFSIFMDGFSKISRNGRLQRFNESISNLPEQVSDKITKPFEAIYEKNNLPLSKKLKLSKDLFKENYSQYITMSQSAIARLEHQQIVNRARIAFSNDITDVAKNLKTSLNDLKHNLNVEDISSRRIFISTLNKVEQLSEFGIESLRKDILSDIDLIMEKIKQANKNSKQRLYSTQEINKIQKLTNSMKEILTDYSGKGIIQDIQTDMKAILSKEDYQIWKAKTEQLNEYFNSAVDTEMKNMVEKYSEAKVGAIPTDIFFQGLAVGTGAYHIAKSEDNKEKIGSSLKYGMPILGGVATYYYSASKALSGITNISLAAISAFLLNRTGDSIFNHYQKRFGNKKEVEET